MLLLTAVVTQAAVPALTPKAEVRNRLTEEIAALEAKDKDPDNRHALLPTVDRLIQEIKELDDPNLELRARRIRIRVLDSLDRQMEALEQEVPLALEAARNSRRPDSARIVILRQLVTLWGKVGKRYEQVPVFQDIVESARRSGEKLQEAYALRSLGDYYTAVGKPEKAKDYLLQALEKSTQVKSSPNIAMCHESLGERAVAAGDYDEAFSHYALALPIYERLNDADNQVDITVNFGRLELKRGNYSEAAGHFEHALELTRDEPTRLVQRNGQARVGLATAYRMLGRPAEARALLEPLAQMAGRSGEVELRVRFLREYTHTLEALGEYKTALEFSHKLAAANEAFVGEQAQNRLNELELAFGLTKKNLEIDLLKQKEREKEANLRATAADLRAVESRAEREHTQRNVLVLSLVLVATLFAAVATFFIARQRSRQRAAQLQLENERQLMEAKRLESLGVLASGIAHDFNNLLTVIMGNAELLRLDPRFENQPMPEITSVLQACQQASALCRQMLQYSGKEYSNVSALNLEEVLTSLITTLRPTAPKCRIVFSEPAEPMTVLADVGQTRQLFQNLLNNALESIDGKSGSIELSVQNLEVSLEEAGRYIPPVKPGRYCCVTIRDDGPGIPTENLGRIFEPFFTTKFLGRGLGLSVVAGILRNHQGGIAVDSMVGRGAVFRVILPQVSRENVATKSAAKPTLLVTRPKRKLGEPVVVLLADDEEMVRTVVATQLKKLGCRVIEAANGNEALELHRKHMREITLALLDVEMPARNGIEACHAIREVDPQLPLYLFSGYSEPSELATAITGLAGFLPKPISQSDLKRIVTAAVGS